MLVNSRYAGCSEGLGDTVNARGAELIWQNVEKNRLRDGIEERPQKQIQVNDRDTYRNVFVSQW